MATRFNLPVAEDRLSDRPKYLNEDAISTEVGNDLIELKKPQFSHNSDFATDVFSQQFDFIIPNLFSLMLAVI
jgi:hypothetical protein